MGPSRTCANMGSGRTCGERMGPSRTCGGNMGPVRTCGMMGPSEKCGGKMGPVRTCDGKMGPVRTCNGKMGPVRTCNGKMGPDRMWIIITGVNNMSLCKSQLVSVILRIYSTIIPICGLLWIIRASKTGPLQSTGFIHQRDL